ncbi:MAG TPA: homoserine dehydrogenase [Candidatus Eubacterium pullicola]|nr:homoserine dehydrogenase [Candidatus Eubacterium pullicola]
MKKIKVGMLGFGNVGTGTYQTLEMNRELIEKHVGASVEISKILVNNVTKPRQVVTPDGVLTDNVADIIDNPEIDIVAEVLGGIEPASEYMLKALNNGKHVVTANKAAVAANYDKLFKAAADNGVSLRPEACVAGGIPILNAITTVLGANKFDEILGILNGTTNYILTQMTDNGLDYADVLKDAQANGFAEADPTADVEGIDAANKLSIMMALAFGHYVHPDDIPTEGISKITKADIDKATADGCKIKLIASAKNEDGKLTYSVKPVALPIEHPLASVSNEFNAVFVKGNAVGELMFYGKGAGPLPTGSAVMGDILMAAKEIAESK